MTISELTMLSLAGKVDLKFIVCKSKKCRSKVLKLLENGWTIGADEENEIVLYKERI